MCMTDQKRALTPLRASVMELVCKGYTNQQVADELGLSINTVKTQLAFIFTYYDVKNRVQAINAYKLEKEQAQHDN